MTPPRKKTPDLAIIGAGIFGLCIAFHAARRGLATEVFEARKTGTGASGGPLGVLSPHMPDNWNAKKAFQRDALADAGNFWTDIERHSGLPTGFGRIGRLIPLQTERARELAEARAAEAIKHWPPEATWRVIDNAPNLSATHGFIHETLTARLFPPHALTALARATRAAGVTIHENSCVAAHDLAARNIVIAAGHECATAYAHWPHSFSRGVKGQAAMLSADLADMPVVYDDGLYIVPHPGLGVAVGSTSEPDWTCAEKTDAALEDVIARARSRVPALWQCDVIHRWSGIRPRARFPDPAIGEIEPGIWVATGGFRIGLALGPAIGAAVASMIAGQKTHLPPSFRLSHHLAE